MDTVKTWIVAALCAATITTTAWASEQEITCLAKNIYFEARDQTREGRFAIAMVTLNRVASDRFPDSVCEVVYQKNQFSWYWDGKSDTPFEKEAWQEAYLVAKATYVAYPNLYDPTSGALFYKRHDARSKYFNRLTHIVTIGDHWFYK